MRKIFILMMFACLCFASQATASDYGFSLYLSGETNVPFITLQNTSDQAHSITGFSMTIGDTAGASFDYSNNFILSSSDMTYSTGDDSKNSGTWYDTLNFTFTNFNVGDFFTFRTDIDGINSNLVKDYRTVLFNNGDNVLNSMLTVLFADGTTVESYMPDYISSSLPVYAHSDGTAHTPIPGAIWLLGSGLIGLAGFKKRKTA